MPELFIGLRQLTINVESTPAARAIVRRQFKIAD
jgi:hypothetical protein